MKKFWLGIKNNCPLLLVVIIGGALRFYRLRELTTFGGDQGVDYLNVARMILERDLTLLGPVTHVGIYLGPLYYYLLAPFFLLFRFDPLAAPMMFALLGTATVGLVYKLAKQLFHQQLQATAALAALLYAVSPVIIESSRAPSQPHLIPFFATLILISLLRVFRNEATKWDGLALGISLASAIQFHFLAYPLFLVAGVILVHKLLNDSNHLTVVFWLWMIVPMTTLLLPWGLFELKHNFFITKQVIEYLSAGEVKLSPVGVAERTLDLIWFSFDRLVGQGSQLVTAGVIVTTIAGAVRLLGKRKIGLMVGYFLINILGIALYLDPLANHYISALYPAVILLTVIGLVTVFGNRIGRLAVVGLVVINLSGIDLFRDHGYTMPSGVTMRTIQSVADSVAADVHGHQRSFNIANTLDGDTRAQPYRYLLTAVHRLPPESVENYPDASFLYIVSRRLPTELLTDNRWELASFPVAKAAIIRQLDTGIYLYRWTRGDVSRQEVIDQAKELEI